MAPQQSSVPSRRSGAPSDAALVVAARAGEAWAQEALFLRHGPSTNRLAMRLLGADTAEVDDLVQESFIAAFTRLDRLREPGTFAAWLSSIVVRTGYNRLRRRRLLTRLGLRRPVAPDFDGIPLERALSPEVATELRLVYDRISELEPAARIAFVLRYVEGLELTEVAARMGISLATAKRRITEAHARLGYRREGA